MPATHQKKLQGEQSRRRLIEAAAMLISEGGYAGTSVEAIAKKAGVVKSALYWHFGSKRGLLEITLKQTCEGWMTEMDTVVEDVSSPLERVDSILGLMRSLIVERPETRRMLFSLLLERGSGDEACRAAISETLFHLRQRVAQCITGRLEMPSQRAQDLADTLLCWCDGLFLRYLADKDETMLDRGLNHMRSVLAKQALDILREPIRDQFTPVPAARLVTAS
ncbi:MAG: TetR/AcrR family transcriptional regulator [Bradymonadia bacterium]